MKDEKNAFVFPSSFRLHPSSLFESAIRLSPVWINSWSLRCRRRIGSQGEKLVAIGDEENAVGRDGRAVNAAPHIDLGQDFLLLPRLHDNDVAVLVSEIELTEIGRA